MNLAIVGVTIIAFIYFTTKAKVKENKEFAAKQRRKYHNRFAFYYNNIMLRKRFRRIVELYSSLSAYDYDTVKVQAVQLFERNAAIVILVPIISQIIMKDISITILMTFMGIVYYESAIEADMDKIFVKLMEECSLCISSMREKFMETDSIPLCVLYAEKSSYLEVPLTNIYRILTDVNGDKRFDDFIRSYPVRIIKTLAEVCWIVNEQGTVRRENGSNSFAEQLVILRQECDSEVRRLTKQRIAFKSLQWLSLLGLIVSPIAEFYLLSQIPGTAVLLKGFYGEVLHLLIVICTIVAFKFVTSATRPSVVNQVDKSQVIDSLAKRRKVSNFIEDIIPKKFKTRAKLDANIRNALSSRDYQYVYTEKVVYASLFAIGMFLFLCISCAAIRSNFKNNYNSLSFIPMTVTETQLHQIKVFDDAFLQVSEEEYAELKDEDLTKRLKGSFTGMSDSDIANQVDRVRAKYEGYHNAKYHWWFVLVAYVAAILGWFVPEISLMMRKQLVQYEAGDDIMQLQTIMIVLADTKMSVYDAIYWLEVQSTVHKAPLRLCHYTYSADPLKALDILEQASPLNDFKRLVRKLKSAVYTLSLSDAFSDMALDKSQSLSLREMLRDEELESRKNSAKLIAIAPAGLALVGSFVAPVLILGITQMMDTLTALQDLQM